MVHVNLKIYKRPPTSEEILEAVKKSRLKRAAFERAHGLYKDAIYQALKGMRNIPVQHWHLFIPDEKKPSKSSSRRVLKTNTPKLAALSDSTSSDSEELGSLIDKLTG